MKFYLAGQQNFGNRGCEALVRSISGLVRRQLPDARFLVPTFDEERDRGQWPEIDQFGGEFVAAPRVPPIIKWWNRGIRLVPSLIPVWEPRFSPARQISAQFKACDAVLMTGGDVISLDYGPGSLFQWSGLMDAAHREGKPTMLFAASVGPFERNSAIERYMVRHLRRYSAVSVRETVTLAYLKSLGVENAVLSADPAFTLEAQPFDLNPIFDSPNGVLAFNMSPLVAAAWTKNNSDGSLLHECAAFLTRVLTETDLAVALLPHVDPLDGAPLNSDSHFLESILAHLGGASSRIALLPRGLNAAQLKHAIGASRFLIAARTHATIAGWSQCVPTLSIAYSVKARGLNQDLFDTLDYVLETPKVSARSLWESFRLLVDNEDAIKATLRTRIPHWRSKAAESVAILKGLLR